MNEEMKKLSSFSNLESIRMVSSRTGTILSDRSEAGNDLGFAFDHQISGRATESFQFQIKIDVSISIIDLQDEPSKQPYVWIDASYSLNYRLSEKFGAERPSSMALDEFGSATALFNLWPYVREFTQSSLVRMDLPPITLPLLRRNEFFELDEAKKSA